MLESNNQLRILALILIVLIFDISSFYIFSFKLAGNIYEEAKPFNLPVVENLPQG